jgi:predicted RND superfamily exporter protein
VAEHLGHRAGLLPLAAALTCAAMVLLGRPFDFANVVVLPMLVGMGVDNGVHLVHRHRTRPDEIAVLASSTARAVLLAAATTVLCFGTLGIFLTLVSYVVILPAILEWDDRRRTRPEAAVADAAAPN